MEILSKYAKDSGCVFLAFFFSLSVVVMVFSLGGSDRAEFFLMVLFYMGLCFTGFLNKKDRRKQGLLFTLIFIVFFYL